MIQEMLERNPDLRENLFIRGFLVTEEAQNESGYPFYGAWIHHKWNQYHVYIHPAQTFYSAIGKNGACFLIGHAYDYVSMEIDERDILQRVADCTEDRLQILNELTGVFTVGWLEENRLVISADCAGMQVAYYGCINGKLFLSSHMQLVGDLCGLKQSEYVKELVAYRLYPYYGAYLPGDISEYDELKRVVPNTLVSYDGENFQISRIYPVRELKMCSTEEDYRRTLQEISDILHRNMQLIARKWNKPAISMTGGMDSKATLAAANGLYDRFRYFSYDSMPGEKIDAEAAHKIAKAIGVPHHIDRISNEDGDFENIKEVREILQHNYGNIGLLNNNDIRKRIYYAKDENRPFDVEVKSWVSEIGRANYYKKFGLKHMPKHLTPRQMTSMYKLFIYNRKLVKKTDDIFSEYIEKTQFRKIFNYDSSDMFLWEIRYGSWGGQVITCEHKYSFDITVPYNNRLLMDKFLSTPLKKRISDQVHFDLIRLMNSAIDRTGITVTNYNETKTRMYKEKLYFLVHSILPF